MKRWGSLLLALTLLLSGCGAGGEALEETSVRLWFTADDRQADYGHGPALVSQPYTSLPGEALEPEQLLAALLSGPTWEGMTSPFPRGVTLRRCSWDEEHPGVLLVDLSEQYGALADIALTLADCCIVLTLSQVEGVEAVEITAGGRKVSYRSHQLLSSEEAVLWDELARQDVS